MKIFTRYFNSTGLAITETIISLPLVFTCLILSLLFFYIHVQHLWTDHHLYQALICLAEGQPTKTCKDELIKKTKTFLWPGRLTNIQLHKILNKKQWKGRLTWKSTYWRLDFKKQINLNQTGFEFPKLRAPLSLINKLQAPEFSNTISINNGFSL